MFDFIKNNYPELLEQFPSLKKESCGCGGLTGILQMLISEKIKENNDFPDDFNELEYNDRRMVMSSLAVINTHSCVNCSMKHLASAIVEMGELRKGYWNTDHEIFCMGNLTEASEQMDAYSNDIAMQLRNLRIDIFETQKLVTEEHLAQAKDLFWKIKKIAEPDIVIKESKPVKVAKNTQIYFNNAQAKSQALPNNAPRTSGCGCKKNKQQSTD